MSLSRVSRRCLLALAFSAAAAPSFADDSDIFLVDAVPPNIMILFDSSGSMGHPPGGVGSTDKIDIAKDVVTNLISNIPDVNWGVIKFNDDSSGGEMVAPLGTEVDTIISRINNISPTGNTPLGNTLLDIQEYFSNGYLQGFTVACNSDDDDDDDDGDRWGSSWGDEDEDEDRDEDADYGCVSGPITSPCQESYVIVVTDGLPTGEAENLIAEVAADMFTSDHSQLSGMQNIITFTVGFDVPDGTALLTQTAVNGGGAFYTASNQAELEQSLEDAISQILGDSYSFAAPMFPSTSSADATKAYLASFEPHPTAPFWEGHLKAYAREADGTIPVDEDNLPDESAMVWDAGTVLAAKAASTRSIYTVISGTRADFTTSNASLTQAMLGVTSSTARTRVINFIRGTDAYDADGDGNTSEERSWKLGDIFHSAPVLVFPPPLESDDETYQAFKAAQANRTTVILVGANDGMLHAFRASDGQELWGFVPPDMLSSLRFLGANVGSYRYYVDGTPVIADVKVSGTWKTVALFGARRGGRVYYALDITDTTNPQYLWRFTSARLGETWSTPVIGKVKLAGNVSKTVAFIGGGYDTANNNATGKAFFVVDLETGSKLWEYYATGSDDASKMNFSLAANPTAVDLDQDGYVDKVYIGDVGGQLWKFDLSAPGTLSSGVVTNWTGRRLFAASPSQDNPPAAGEYHPEQAIYGAPAVAYDSLEQLWIFFGTGNRNEPNSDSDNRFYGIKDDGAMTQNTTITEASLEDMTSGEGEVDGPGWFMELSSDEKVFDAASVFNRVVYFTSYEPGTTGECDQEAGIARLYAVNMDGTSPELWEEPDEDDDRATVIGSGIPSAPQLVGNDGGALLVVGTTSQELTMDTIEFESEFQLRYWREVY